MKLYIWIGVLALIVFGVGWTGHAVTDKLTDTQRDESTSRDDRLHPASRWGRGPTDRFGIEPFIGTVEYYARELELSAEQKSQMEHLVAAATEKIRERERANRQLLGETRSKVRNLLTPEQRERIDKLIEDRFRTWREDRLAKVSGWLEENTPYHASVRSRVVDVIRTYYEERLASRTCFDRQPPGGADADVRPTREQMAARESALLEKRDAALRELLTEEEFEEFRRFERSQHSYGRGRRGRAERHGGPTGMRDRSDEQR